MKKSVVDTFNSVEKDLNHPYAKLDEEKIRLIKEASEKLKEKLMFIEENLSRGDKKKLNMTDEDLKEYYDTIMYAYYGDWQIKALEEFENEKVPLSQQPSYESTVLRHAEEKNKKCKDKLDAYKEKVKSAIEQIEKKQNTKKSIFKR